MHITQWGEYGVLICIYIAERQKAGAELVSALDIAESQHIELDYVHQILKRLRSGSFLVSTRGPKGGYKITRDINQISLHDILVASEGSTFDVICEAKPLNNERCLPGSACNLRPIWKALQHEINGFLTGVSLEDIINKKFTDAFATEMPIQISARAES